jgi:hypothetical protein
MNAAKLPKKMITQNVRLDDATMGELRAIAVEENRTISNLISTIIRDWLTQRRAKQAQK